MYTNKDKAPDEPIPPETPPIPVSMDGMNAAVLRVRPTPIAPIDETLVKLTDKLMDIDKERESVAFSTESNERFDKRETELFNQINTHIIHKIDSALIGEAKQEREDEENKKPEIAPSSNNPQSMQTQAEQPSGSSEDNSSDRSDQEPE